VSDTSNVSNMIWWRCHALWWRDL